MALKGGASQNSGACKKGGQPKIPLSFAVTASVIMQTFYRIAFNIGLWRSETNSNFSGEHVPRTPSLLCALEQFYPTCCLIAKYSQKINLGETILKW